MLTTPLFPTLGPTELIVVLVIVMIFFGVGKLPEIGAALGKGLKGFKEAQRGIESGDGLEVASAEMDDAEESP